MPEEKRVLVLLIESINYDARVQKEIATLLSLGFGVTLAVWNYYEPIRYENRDIEIIDVDLSDHKNPKNPLASFWKTVRYWRICARMIRRGDYAYIHCNDLNTLGVLAFLPKRYWGRIVYDAHELFPECYSAGSLRYRIWSWLERRWIRKAGAVIAPESNRAAFLKEKYGLPETPRVVCNYPRRQDVRPRDLRAHTGLPPEAKLLCYQGIIARGRDVDKIIGSLALLPERYALIVIGFAYDDSLEELKALARSLGLEDRVIFHGKAPPDEMLETIGGADISVALYRNSGMNTYLCASNKVFDALMAGLKVITSDFPPHQMLRRHPFVRLVAENTAEEIARCVLELDTCEREVDDEVKRQYSWESCARTLAEVYGSIPTQSKKKTPGEPQ
jgi:glycosyltransferase involved in cell wall biosynthesis